MSRSKLNHTTVLRVENRKSLTPICGLIYNISRDELLIFRKTQTDFLSKGWLRLSSSAAAVPVTFTKKPNRGLRFYVDHSVFNAITIPDRYPLLIFKETLRRLSKVKWVTELEVKSAFHRKRIKESDDWTMAFPYRFGLFEWLVTFFGLINAPATFQRNVNGQWKWHLHINITAYMDDVLVYIDMHLVAIYLN